MNVIPFSEKYLDQIAALFIENYRRQCLATPALPVNKLDQRQVEQKLIGAFGLVSGRCRLSRLSYLSENFGIREMIQLWSW